MLVDTLLTVLYGFLQLVFGSINLPTFPDSFMSYVDIALDYLESGMHLLGNYVDLSYMVLLLEIFISLWLAFELYKFVMWVLRKIPILNIK